MHNDELSRFGVSIPGDLLQQFDKQIQTQGYGNRSEAIRDLIRKSLLQPPNFPASQCVAGTIVMVYDHHVSELPLSLIELQHKHHHDIISTMHIHLNHEQCLEILVVRGEVQRLRELCDQIRVLKGVLYAELSVTHIDSEHRPHHHDHLHADT
ncbi:CopG family nickel-responsive transcriptional regulator [Paenibacillus phyllosphaerae]|uniref:Putative nickel-responsive regulator n=1 Tax=Paenibacillus phyllosphaerae TaxID=274593 RepID=A0A7W5FPV4_9BACL|nr:nickel-responsive transcriptional regulator NikR [Paenibacillus phyllosphaerae]MBB3112811.1 CopG family nickel-responsive transcriptional regulator [Paenibacillus phyllosphaerae]